MKSNLIYLFALLVVTLTGCTKGEEWLDLEPVGTRTEANAYRTATDALEALSAAYDPLQWQYTSEHTYGPINFIGDMTSDDAWAGGESSQDLQYFYQFDNLGLIKSDNGALRIIYRVRYNGIYRANQGLEKIVDISFDEKDRYLSECKFLRAYYYMDLVRVFGSIAYLDHTATSTDDWKQDLKSPEFVWGKIIEDLLAAQASNALPMRADLDESELGRVTQSTVWAYLAKAYLYTKNYTESAKWAQKVIDSGDYILMPNMGDNFPVSIAQMNENTAESIFEVQYTNTSSGSYNRPEGSEGCHLPQLQGIRDLKNSTKYQAGWGFNLPTQNLVNAYPANDPRIAATVITYAELDADGATYLKNHQNEGYFNKKFAALIGATSQSGADHLNWAINLRAMRYAELLLIAAEAYANLGDNAKGQMYVNMVRERSLPGNKIGSSGAALVDDILNERRLELAMEGHRWFDLHRTGKAATMIADYNSLVNGYFPIPKQEMDLSGWN